MISLISNQKGLSLVELLIAMVLGLLLMAGALQMMLSSRTTYNTTDTLSRIQENGRFSLNFLAKSIRMAGHKGNENNDDSTENKVFWDRACGASDPCTANGAGTDSDQIGVLMDPTNDQDCLGNDVGANSFIVNVYSVADLDNDQINSLYCQGYNPATSTWLSNPQPLVDGIENMQVLYGVVDPLTNIITRYVSADGVVGEEWGKIGAVKIALLVNNGQARGNGALQQRSFNLLDAPNIAITDQHNRQAFTTTVAINNVIYRSRGTNL